MAGLMIHSNTIGICIRYNLANLNSRLMKF